MIDQVKIKEIYPQPDHAIYLDTASAGLISKSGIEKTMDFHQDFHKYGSKIFLQFITEELPRIRETVSQFLDDSVHEVAMIPNFSYGLNAVITSLSKLKRVLLFKEDFPSLTQPFLIGDFKVYWIESEDGFTIDMGELQHALIQNDIEILAISHVQYLSGFTIDIDSLGLFCKQHSIVLIVDGTQSLGNLNFSFRKSLVNIYISSNYKWMNAGYGTGILLIKQETLDAYTPKIGGYHSYKFIDNQWKYLPSILSYQPGHPNIPGLIMLKDALDFKIEIGMEFIHSHNLKLAKMFLRLNDRHASNRIIGSKESIIIGIRGDIKLANYLEENNIMMKFHNEIIRIGFHFYNTESDVEGFIEALVCYQE